MQLEIHNNNFTRIISVMLILFLNPNLTVDVTKNLQNYDDNDIQLGLCHPFRQRFPCHIADRVPRE